MTSLLLSLLLPLGLAAMPVPAAVTLEGVPEVPDRLVAALEPYTETRSAGLTDFAPDGRSMLITTRFGDTAQVHALSGPGAARTQLTFGREPGTGGVRAADGALLFSRDVGGDENHQILRLVPGRPAEGLTEPGTRNGRPLLDRTRTRLAFSSTARNGEDADVWLMNADGSDRRVLVQAEGTWSPSAWSSDGAWLAVTQYVSAVRTDLWLVNLASGQRYPLSDPAAPAFEGGVAFAPDFAADGGRLWVVSDRDGEHRRLYAVTWKAPQTSKGKGKRTSVPAVEWKVASKGVAWDVEELAVNERSVVVAVNEGGFSRLYRVDPATLALSPGPALPPGVIGGLALAEQADVLAFSLSGPRTPGDVWTADLDGGPPARWTASEAGGLDPSDFVVPEVIAARSFDGLEVPGLLYRPEGEGPFPVVVQIHGGPEGQARPWFNPAVQYLVGERKVAVLQPNVRGSSGYGRAWLQLDDGRRREDSVKDIGAFLDLIASDPGLDAARVAVMGGSYGGYMALASLVHFGERLRAGIDIVGIASFVTFLENTAPYRQDLRRVEYGDERDPAMREFLHSISPLTHAHRIETPLFVAHGANDPRVPVGEARQIADAVRTQGRDVWVMIASDEGHGFSRKPNRDLFTALSVLFLERHLELEP